MEQESYPGNEPKKCYTRFRRRREAEPKVIRINDEMKYHYGKQPRSETVVMAYTLFK